MKSSFYLSIKGTCKESIADSLAKLARLQNTRDYVSKEKAMVLRRTPHYSAKNPLIYVGQISENKYEVKLSKKTMSSLLENITTKHLSREIKINPCEDD